MAHTKQTRRFKHSYDVTRYTKHQFEATVMKTIAQDTKQGIRSVFQENSFYDLQSYLDGLYLIFNGQSKFDRSEITLFIQEFKDFLDRHGYEFPKTKSLVDHCLAHYLIRMRRPGKTIKSIPEPSVQSQSPPSIPTRGRMGRIYNSLKSGVSRVRNGVSFLRQIPRSRATRRIHPNKMFTNPLQNKNANKNNRKPMSGSRHNTHVNTD